MTEEAALLADAAEWDLRTSALVKLLAGEEHALDGCKLSHQARQGATAAADGDKSRPSLVHGVVNLTPILEPGGGLFDSTTQDRAKPPDGGS